MDPLLGSRIENDWLKLLNFTLSLPDLEQYIVGKDDVNIFCLKESVIVAERINRYSSASSEILILAKHGLDEQLHQRYLRLFEEAIESTEESIRQVSDQATVRSWFVFPLQLPKPLLVKLLGPHEHVTTFRLIRRPALTILDQASHQIHSMISSSLPLKFVAEGIGAQLALNEWLNLNCNLLPRAEASYHTPSVLPKGWRWLSLSTSSHSSSINLSCQLTSVTSLERYKERLLSDGHSSQNPLQIVSLSQKGDITCEVLLKGQLHSLNQLSEEDWEELLGISPSMLNPDHPSDDQVMTYQKQDPSLHITTPPPSVKASTGATPFVVDYADVLSGIGSEASTLYSPKDESEDSHAHHISDDQSNGSIEESSPETSRPDGTIEKSYSSGFSVQSIDQPNQATEHELTDQAPDASITERLVEELQGDLEALRDLIDFSEADESGVIDYSLSDLNPVSEQQSPDLTESSFQEALVGSHYSITNSNPISVDRSFDIHSSANKHHSIVTNSVDENHDDELGYHTVNQSTADQFHSLQTLNQRSQVASSESDQSHLQGEFGDISDMDDLPTRIDIDVAQVERALEYEQGEAVTRVAQLSSQDHQEEISAGNITQIEALSPQLKAAPVQRSAELEALSREDTTKLKVSDFEALTEIKESDQDLSSTAPMVTNPRPAHLSSHARTSRPPQPNQLTRSSGSSPHVSPTTPPQTNQNVSPDQATLPAQGPHLEQSVHPQQISSPPNDLSQHAPLPNSTLPPRSRPVQQENPVRTHRSRRSFSDVIRSLTSKNKS